MASKNFEMPLPFRLVKQVPPKAWELCDKCMELKSKMQWNDLCILPIGAGFSVADAIGYIPPRDAHKISALYAWRKYKEIYSFDDDFAQILMEQGEDDMDIPIDILLQLPYPCIYIQFGKEGMFCFFEHDVNTNHMEFRMWRIDDTSDAKIENGEPIILHIDGKSTCKESVQKLIDDGRRYVKDSSLSETAIAYRNYMDENPEIMGKLYARYLQLVLYICADNSEREENAKQKTVTKRSSDYSKKPKDVFREIRKWDVGFRIGSMIRKAKQTEHSNEQRSESTTRSGGTKAPHTRRGHWHHFWIGKMDGERKLILKWVAPMFINGNEDDVITTIHEVKGDTDV